MTTTGFCGCIAIGAPRCTSGTTDEELYIYRVPAQTLFSMAWLWQIMTGMFESHTFDLPDDARRPYRWDAAPTIRPLDESCLPDDREHFL